MNERIDNKTYEKNIMLFKWLAIVGLILIIIQLNFAEDILYDLKLSDFITPLLTIGFWIQYLITARKWGGQFIAWKENEVEFKSRKYEQTIIPYNSINEINIKLDIIEIRTFKQVFEINIEDYTDYEDRVKLKRNFEKIKEKLSTTMAINNAGCSG